jgi:tetrahydromethanopterin:alpha-L-glutamate ligase
VNPPRIVTLVSGFGWHVDDLTRAARVVGVRLEAVAFDRLNGFIGQPGRSLEAGAIRLDQADGVLVRMMPPGSLEQVVFRMDALHRLAAAGVPVVNPPRAVETAVDKYLSLSRLAAAGLPVPPTFAGESARAAFEAYEQLGPDVVVKPLFGSEGRGIVRVSDPELARRTFHTLERLGAVIYVQKTVRHPGYDHRAFVLDGRILAAMRRTARAGEWRTNVAVGGRPERSVLSPEVEQLALRAAEAVGAVVAGVDILDDLDRGGPVVLEVNAVPGWRALAGATGVDVAAALLETLRSRMR